MIHNALPIRNWWHDFFGFKILPQFLAHKNMLQCRENLKAKITQLLPNRISGPLILNGRLNLTVLAQRNQAVHCESGMRFLSFLMWSVRCSLCRVHSPTPSSTGESCVFHFSHFELHFVLRSCVLSTLQQHLLQFPTIRLLLTNIFFWLDVYRSNYPAY